MSNDDPSPPPAPTEAPPTPPPIVASQPAQTTCPNCFSLVSVGAAYCPNCGNALPPSWPTAPPPFEAPRRRRTGLVIGIVLLVVLVGGAVGYFVYNNSQHQVLFAAKNSEQTAANQAPSQIRFTCFAVTPDASHLSYDQYTHTYSGYAIINEKFGLSNPTTFTIDSTWTITLDYTLINIILTSTTLFHLAANGAAQPIFAFQMTGAQYNTLPPSPDFTKFTVSLSATYTITGTYSTYHVTQQSTYNSVTGTGTGTLASTGTTNPC